MIIIIDAIIDIVIDNNRNNNSRSNNNPQPRLEERVDDGLRQLVRVGLVQQEAPGLQRQRAFDPCRAAGAQGSAMQGRKGERRKGARMSAAGARGSGGGYAEERRC